MRIQLDDPFDLNSSPFDRDRLDAATQRALDALDPAQFPEARAQLAEALRDGDAPYYIASMLLGCDRPKDLPPHLVDYIIDLYEMEIAEGNDDAMIDLGVRFYIGDRGFAQDFKRAMALYQMAAERGNSHAWQNLGYCYYYGRDGAVDYEKAFRCFATGAFEGRPVSLYKIGDMYLNGYYVEKNPEEACRIYQRCLELRGEPGFDDAAGPVRLRLGNLYLNGIGTVQDPMLALEHYGQAELLLIRMIQNGDFMYKNSLREAIEGQARARALLMEDFPADEWTLDG